MLECVVVLYTELTVFWLSRSYIFDVDSDTVDLGNVADVSELHTASIVPEDGVSFYLGNIVTAVHIHAVQRPKIRINTNNL